jgi:hypothetical protein
MSLMKWHLRNEDVGRPGRRVAAGASAGAGLILLSSVAGLQAANTGVAPPAETIESVQPLGTAAPNQISGVLQKIDGPTLTVISRKGASVLVNDAEAVQAYRASPLVVGKAFTFGGTYDPRGKLLATIILRTKSATDTWPKDR